MGWSQATFSSWGFPVSSFLLFSALHFYQSSARLYQSSLWLSDVSCESWSVKRMPTSFWICILILMMIVLHLLFVMCFMWGKCSCFMFPLMLYQEEKEIANCFRSADQREFDHRFCIFGNFHYSLIQMNDSRSENCISDVDGVEEFWLLLLEADGDADDGMEWMDERWTHEWMDRREWMKGRVVMTHFWEITRWDFKM